MGKKKNEEGAPKLIACNCRACAARGGEGSSLEELAALDFLPAAEYYFRTSLRLAFAAACQEYNMQGEGQAPPGSPVTVLLSLYRDVLEALINVIQTQDPGVFNYFREQVLDPVPQEQDHRESELN